MNFEYPQILRKSTPEVLTKFAKHYQTGKAVPSALLKRLQAAWPTHLASVRRHIVDHLGELDLPRLAQALRDTKVGDVAVHKNDMVWGVLRHNSVSEPWFADPAAFKPERWLADAPQPLSHDAKRASLPFGAGPRMCPGRYLALLEMKMAMAMLLASFEIDQVSTPDNLPPQELMAFTMNPVGLSLRLKARDSAV